MMKRHCDICDEEGAHPISIPTRQEPDPSGSGRSDTSYEHIDLCGEHLRETLQHMLKTAGLNFDDTLRQGRKIWKDLYAQKQARTRRS